METITSSITIYAHQICEASLFVKVLFARSYEARLFLKEASRAELRGSPFLEGITRSRRLNTQSRRLNTQSRRLDHQSCRLNTQSRRLGSQSRRLGTQSRRLGTQSRKLGTQSRRLDPFRHLDTLSSATAPHTQHNHIERNMIHLQTTGALKRVPHSRAECAALHNYYEYI